ncbi:MAG: glycosyltransferase [Clostridiales bacterium]|nr:glycosyltransferase [Clostridiales bacterium]
MNNIGKLEKNFISIVVYVQNHEKYIEEFIHKVTSIMDSNFEKSEFIFVNDFGKDNTLSIIKEKFRKYTDKACTVINLSYEHKVERAMIAGQDIAIGDFVYEFDTPIIDYNIEKIIEIYHKCLTGYDIVSASPDTNKLTSKMFYKIFEKYSTNNTTLQSERFRVLSRRGINRIKNVSQTIPYRKAVYFNCGLKATTISFESSKDKLNDIHNNTTLQNVDFAADSLLFFTNIGWKISALMSTIMISFSLCIGMYTFITWLVNENVISGWTTIMMFLSIVFSVLFVLITIIIKYLSLVLFININKQDYVFESVDKIK